MSEAIFRHLARFLLIFASVAANARIVSEPIGASPTGIPIISYCLFSTNPSQVAERPVVLVVGTQRSPAGGADILLREFTLYQRDLKLQRRMRIEAVTDPNPSGAPLTFPPNGDAYRDQPESHAIWRWIVVRSPDLIVVAGPAPNGLEEALAHSTYTRGIPVQRVDLKTGLLKRIKPPASRSQARQESEQRLARTPAEVARQLEAHYGHDLADAVYIPGVALMARLKLGHLADVERIVKPYITGERDSLVKPTGSHLAGHLLFAELAAQTGNPAYTARVKAAADLGFDPVSGAPLESMPFHNRMSDAVFMGGPILVKAAKLTRESKYNDLALRHYRFMRKLDLRPDGLWRHSPFDEAAWGRGNAFALLGLALTLEDLPPEHPGFDEMLTDFRSHAAALARHQTSDGMWRQIIDAPESYREFSATAMIGTALLKGIRRGWLSGAAYQRYVESAWDGIKVRTWADGTLLDVCESTGAQKSREDYLNRKAIFDRDPRGGAMALLFSTELN